MENLNQYRIAEGYGNYFNKRYEVQKRYYYPDSSGKLIEAWGLCFHSTSYEECEKILKKYLTINKPSFQLDELIF